MTQKIVIMLEFDAPDAADVARMTKGVEDAARKYLTSIQMLLTPESNAPIDLRITYDGVEEV